MSRNSWRENGAGMRHSVGVGAPDPWLLNTQTKRAQMRRKVKALPYYYLQTVFKNTTLFERLNSNSECINISYIQHSKNFHFGYCIIFSTS